MTAIAFCYDKKRPIITHTLLIASWLVCSHTLAEFGFEPLFKNGKKQRLQVVL